MKSRQLFIPISILLVIAAVIVWGIIFGVFKKRPDPYKLPIYPNAQNIQTTQPYEIAFGQKWITTFEATASPKEVLAFYQQTMVDAGWQFSGQEDGRLTFIYDDCPFYYIYVSAEDRQGTSTRIELQAHRELCR